MGPRQHTKRKNRSFEKSNVSNGDHSIDNQRVEKKRQRQNSSGRQSTLSEYVDGNRMAARGDTRGDANKTFTTESESDCLSQQLGQIEERINSKIETLHDYLGKIESNIASEIKDQFEKLRGEIFVLQEAYDTLKEKVLETEDALEDMQDEVSSLRKMVIREGERRNDLEQYQRRESVRFLGVGPDSKAEKAEECEHKIITLIRRELKLDIHPADISVLHRVGVPGTRPRPVIVKFITRKHKMDVLAKRRLLKGTKKVIVEDLTPLNMSRLTKTKQHPNVLTTWTKDGKIHALLKNNTVVKVLEGDMTVLSDSRNTDRNAEGDGPETFHGHRKTIGNNERHPFPASPMASTPRHPNQWPLLGGTGQFQRSGTHSADRNQRMGRNDRHRTNNDDPRASGRDCDPPSTVSHGGRDPPSTAGHGGGDLRSTADHGGKDLRSTSGHGGGDLRSTSGHGGGDLRSTAGHGGGDLGSTAGHGGGVLLSEAGHGCIDRPPSRQRRSSDSTVRHSDRGQQHRLTSPSTLTPRPNRTPFVSETQHQNTKL